MQAQDIATTYLFKTWSWVESNLKQVAAALGIVAIAIVLVSYYFWRQNQAELTAGQALTQVFLSTASESDAGQLSDAYLKVAADYPGTRSGGRALVLGATTLFESGKYPEAQAQFQKYLAAYAGGAFAAPAELGVAASLEAQGQTNPATEAYQRIINGFSDPNTVTAAKFALAKIDEQQGKLTEAERFYLDVARNNPNSPIGAEAAFREFNLKTKSPTAVPADGAAPLSTPRATP
jgi:TolA-binding protein